MYRKTFNSIAKKLFEWGVRKREASIRRSTVSSQEKLQQPEFDYEYLTNPANKNEIVENVRKRKSYITLEKVAEIIEKLKNLSKKDKVMDSLIMETSNLPNRSHPDIISYEIPHVVKSASYLKHPFPARQFEDLAKDLELIKKELTSSLGRRSYFTFGDLAELEHALIQYALSKLISKNFKLVSVPDILPAEVIERCGMTTKTTRSQIFFLEDYHGKDLCLSGTSEMALAGLVSNKLFNCDELPLLFTSASRCYRAEVSNLAAERGIFRVHQFSKVEMFGISHPDHSEELQNQFLAIQEDIFRSLGIDFQVLDMPLHELGASAYRKYDIEAWFPGRESFGEISSCSNCTTYQAERLNIKFKSKDKQTHVHTVNGTACAIPRMLIAILETHQLPNGNILLPEPLRKYFNGREEIQKRQNIPKLKNLKR